MVRSLIVDLIYTQGSPMTHTMANSKKKSTLKGIALTKVLTTDFQAMHGGDFDYTDYLPTMKVDGSWVAGEWTPEIENPVLCEVGYHLTNDPYGQWEGDRGLVFLAEGRLAYDDGGRGKGRTDSDKISFSQVRLLSPDDKTKTKLLAKMGASVGAVAAPSNPDPHGIQQLADAIINAPLLNAPVGARVPEIGVVYSSRVEAEYVVRKDGATLGIPAPGMGTVLSAPEYSNILPAQNVRLRAHAASLGWKQPFFPVNLLNYILYARKQYNKTDSRLLLAEAILSSHLTGFGIAGHSSSMNGVALYLYRNA